MLPFLPVATVVVIRPIRISILGDHGDCKNVRHEVQWLLPHQTILSVFAVFLPIELKLVVSKMSIEIAGQGNVVH